MPFCSTDFDATRSKVQIGAQTQVSAELQTRQALGWVPPSIQAWRHPPPSLCGCWYHQSEIQQTLSAVGRWVETDDGWLLAVPVDMPVWE